MSKPRSKRYGMQRKDVRESETSENTNKRDGKRRPFKQEKPKVVNSDSVELKFNSPVFFNRNEQLSKDTTNLPFAWKNGLVYKGETRTDGTRTYDTQFHIPSVVCFNFDYLLGGNNSKNSLNTIANNLYSYVRYVNSGSRNYEAPDLFMYFGAISGCYGLASWIAKCIGLANVASPINRAYPRQVFQAMNVDYDDLISNIAAYRGKLNSLIIRLNAYNVPAKFYCFAEHIWMSSILYIESTNGKDQLYTSRPLSILEFDGTLTGGSCLKLCTLKPEDVGNTIGDALNILTRLILQLETDEDIGIISGDVLKAMGADQCFHMGLVPEDYVAIPSYDETMLMKIKNFRVPVATINSSNIVLVPTLASHVVGTASDWEDAFASGNAVYWQDNPGNVASQIKFSLAIVETDNDVKEAIAWDGLSVGVIDTVSDTPTIDEINEDTSFKFAYGDQVSYTTSGGSVYTGLDIDAVGMGLVRNIKYVRYSGSLGSWAISEYMSNRFIFAVSYGGTYPLAALHDVITFDFMMAHFTAYNSTTVKHDKFLGNYTNVHILTKEELVNIIDAQLLSEYAIPATQHLGKADSFAK